MVEYTRKADGIVRDSILKDGHTMFITDVIQELNNKSFTDMENADLRERILIADNLLRVNDIEWPD